MQAARPMAVIPLLFACAFAMAQDTKGLTQRFTVAPSATVTIDNDYGPITVRAAAANQVFVRAVAASPNVQVTATQDANQNRIQVRTHHLRPGSDSVEYTLEVPSDAAIVVRAISGPIRVDNVAGSITIDSDSGIVTVEQRASSLTTAARNSTVHVRTIDGAVDLSSLDEGKIEVTTVSGAVTLSSATGSSMSVDTNSAPIHFSGNLASGASCKLSTHSGDIDVALPASASIDVAASSVNGNVQDSFQLQPDPQSGSTPVAGKSFAGHSSSGAAKMSLRSFSGKITVRKQ